MRVRIRVAGSSRGSWSDALEPYLATAFTDATRTATGQLDDLAANPSPPEGGDGPTMWPVRLVSWNIDHGKHGGDDRRCAWEYTVNKLGADIALLQEALPPDDALPGTLIWSEAQPRRRWGSAIWTRAGSLAELPVATTFEGWVRAGAWEFGPALPPVLLISLHAQIDQRGYSITTLHRLVSDLTHLLNGHDWPRRGRPQVILGGDFNAGLQWDAVQHNRSHALLFDRIADFGLVDVLRAHQPEFVQTFRGIKRSVIAWELDHVFLSKTLAGKVTACFVDSSETVQRLSDHNPIVVDIEQRPSSSQAANVPAVHI